MWVQIKHLGHILMWISDTLFHPNSFSGLEEKIWVYTEGWKPD